MRYEKPMVMDLSAGARATGQQPLVCLTGDNAAGEFCGTGATPVFDIGCVPGKTAYDCGGGSSATGGACYSGPSAPGYCEVGPTGMIDPGGCDVGPSFVF